MDIGIFNKAYLYLNRGNKSVIIETKYTLTNTIDSNTLKKALNNIIENFHYFKLKPVIDKNGDIDFVLNNEELEVYELDDKIHQLGTEETKGYLFRVTWKENHLHIILSHAIADAKGAMSFGISLIHEYLELMGMKCDLEKEAIIEDTSTSENEVNPFSIDEAEKPQGDYMEEPFVVPVDYEYLGTEYEKKTVMTWNAKDFSTLIHKLECTPVSLMTAMIGNAIYRNYDVKEKKVSASIPVDLRRFLQKQSQANFITSIKLEYREEYKYLAFEEQVKKIRENLKEKLTITNFKRNLFGTEQFFKKVISIPIKTSTDVTKLSATVEEMMKTPEATYMISNLGVIDIPKTMQPYITDFECTTSNTTLSTLYTMMTIGEVGKLVITQNDNSEKIINEIKNIFLENGINVEVKDYGIIKVDAVVPYHFERLT